ncbi:competence protein CoiA family protein [Psychroserpens burtonensis]|uniref:competence protein CoiA family protein n=1 Tax=Psychroserpens burtonensis TaxID=49278 RepID=UPI00041DCD06|nr:competence protein CoiA family protein [Psychroserpens burtonensis]
MKSNLTYAVHNDKLVHISKVISGLACNCKCPNPNCNGKLIARKGNIKSHHFAHYNMEDCGGALESALHLLAKEIISEEKVFKIPELYYYNKKRKIGKVFFEALVIEVDNVELEVLQDDFKPDIVLQCRKTKLFVEIAVTHFVDEKKLKKIENLGISLIEIDLSEFKLIDNITKNILRDILINKTEYKRWIYNSKEALLAEKFLEEYDLNQKIKNRIKEEKLKEKLKKERLLTKIQDENDKKEKSYLNNQKNTGNRLLSFYYSEIVCCPLRLQKYSKTIKARHTIFNKIKSGQYWDGINRKTKGKADYVCFDDEKFFFSPSIHKQEKQGVTKIKEYQKIWAILNSLQKKSKVNIDICRQCAYNIHVLDNSKVVVCKYTKE